MDKKYFYHYNAQLKELSMVVSDSTGKVVWSAKYPSQVEDRASGELLDEPTPIDMGLMKNLGDLEGLKRLLVSEGYIPEDAEIEKKFAAGGSVSGEEPVIEHKKQKYFIREYAGVGVEAGQLKEVEGQKVILPHYEKLDTFTHKDEHGYYNISEARTGLSFGDSTYKTAKQAAERAYFTLLWQQSYNKIWDSIYEIVDDNIKRYGIGNGSLYNTTDKFVPDDELKIKVLQSRLADLENEIAEERKQAARFLSAPNVDFDLRFAQQIKDRIAEIKAGSHKKGGVTAKEFDKVVEHVAQNYEGKHVPEKYQDKYGKTYTHKGAESVGYAVANTIFKGKKKFEVGGETEHAPETAPEIVEQKFRIIAITDDVVIDEDMPTLAAGEKRFDQLKANPTTELLELVAEEFNAWGYVKKHSVVKRYARDHFAEGGKLAGAEFAYGDPVEYTQDGPPKINTGEPEYRKGRPGIVKDVKKVGDEYKYDVHWGLTTQYGVPESHLKRYNADTAEKVQEILNEKQAKKQFKDVGKRVSGSAKERRAYSMITSSDLKDIEADEITAMELVTKQRVYPEVNIVEQKAAGVSSGACYIKVKLREACGNKPPNEKSKRASYILFIENLTKILAPLKTVDEVKAYFDSLKEMPFDQIVGYFIDPTFFEMSAESKERVIAKSKETWLGRIGSYSLVKKLLEEVFSKRFQNFIYNGSDAAAQTFAEAKLYQGLGDEQSRVLVEKYKESKRNYIEGQKKQIEEYKNADTEKLKSLYSNWSGMDRFRKDMEGLRKAAIEYYEKRIVTAEKEIDVIPKGMVARADDWSWFEADKSGKAKVKSGELQINSGTPLAYIKRTKGIVIKDEYVDAAKNTDPEHNPIIRDLGFKSVQFGNALTDKEAKEHIRHFLGAIMDLAEVLDIDIKSFNNIGGLSMAFASRGKGKAAATYERGRVIINLTNKRGDGTLAHEFGHYFDNSVTIFDKNAVSMDYGTTKPQEIKNEKVRAAMKDIVDFFMKGKEGVTPKVMVTYFKSLEEMNARVLRYYNELEKKYVDLEYLDNIEDTFKKLGQETRIFQNLNAENEVTRQAIASAVITHFGYDDYEIEFTTKQSAYRFYSSKMNSKYWIEIFELFARAWETFIFDKLQTNQRMNNYLVGGEYFDVKIPIMSGGWTYIYPFGDERKYLYVLYDHLVSAVKEAMGLKKFTAPESTREDEYIVFEENKQREVVSEDGEVEVSVEKFADGGEVRSILNQDTDLKGDPKEIWMIESDKFGQWLWNKMSTQSREDKALDFAYAAASEKISPVKRYMTPKETSSFQEELQRQKQKYFRGETDWMERAKKAYIEDHFNPTIENYLFEKRYQKAVEEGRMTEADARKIIESAGLKGPEKFVEGGTAIGDGVILYHGSKSEFVDFDESARGQGEGGDLFGKGVYLTDSKTIAEFYAHQTAKKEFVDRYEPTGIFETLEPIFKKNADELADKNKKILTFKFTGKALDEENYIISEEFKKAILELSDKYSPFKAEAAERSFYFLRNNKEKIHHYRGELIYIIQQVGYADKEIVEGITDYVIGMGYDAIKYPSDDSYEGRGAYNYVVFNKGALKKIKENEFAEGGGVDKSNLNFKIAIESITRQVFEGKSLKKAIDSFYKKHYGVRNIFLGVGVLNFTKTELETEYYLDKAEYFLRNKKNVDDDRSVSFFVDRYGVDKDKFIKTVKSIDTENLSRGGDLDDQSHRLYLPEDEFLRNAYYINIKQGMLDGDIVALDKDGDRIAISSPRLITDKAHGYQYHPAIVSFEARTLKGEKIIESLKTIKWESGGQITNIQDLIIDQSLDVPQKQDLVLEEGGDLQKKNLRQINDQFNTRLKEIIKNDNRNFRPLQLGYPSKILLTAGMPNLPIQIAARRLLEKSAQQNHPFDINSVTNMPLRLYDPIAVFYSKEGKDSMIILTEMRYKGVNLVTAIQLKRILNREEINSIRSIYPKNYFWGILGWITNDKLMQYCNKEKILNWLGKQRSNSADVTKLIKDSTKVIKDFENPKLDLENGGNVENQPDKQGKQRSNSTLAELQKIEYLTEEELKTELHAINEAKKKGKEITQAQYTGFRGDEETLPTGVQKTIRKADGGLLRTPRTKSTKRSGKSPQKQITNPTPAEQKIIDRQIKRRWRYKRDAIYTLRDNIDSLKRRVREDLKSDTEKERLTALVVRMMICTSERIGNDNSRENGHFGICGFKPSQIKIDGDRIYLKYKGKSGVMHEREFSDPAAAELLDKLKERKNGYIFTTESGFRIRPEKVNRYLDDFGVTSKDIRGFNANRQMLMKLKAEGKTEEKERKTVFNEMLRKVAAKIGHTPATLRKHYLLPEIEKDFYSTGSVGKIELE